MKSIIKNAPTVRDHRGHLSANPTHPELQDAIANIRRIASLAPPDRCRAAAAANERRAQNAAPSVAVVLRERALQFNVLADLGEEDRHQILANRWPEFAGDLLAIENLVSTAPRAGSGAQLRDHAHRMAKAFFANENATATFSEDRSVISMRDGSVAMDLGIADTNLRRTTAGLFASPSGFVADILAPCVLVDSQIGTLLNIGTSGDASKLVRPLGSSAGAPLPRANPSSNPVNYNAASRGLSASVPIEVVNNADVDLDEALGLFLRNAFAIERESRVCDVLRTTSNWNTNNVQTLDNAHRWNGGGSADPLANVQTAIDASVLPPTHIVMSPTAAKYFFATTSVFQFFAGLERSGATWPKIVIAEAKIRRSGSPSYIIGGDVLLVRCATTPTELGSARTARWSQGAMGLPQGQGIEVDGDGIVLRAFFDALNGPRGLRAASLVVDEDAVITANDVGGLIVGAVQ